MKKIIVFIFLIFTIISVQAQILQTEYYFEAQYMPTGALAGYEVEPTYFTDVNGDMYTYILPKLDNFAQDFRFIFNIEFILYKYIFVGGRLGTTFSLSASPTYGLEGHPDFMDSLFRLGIRYETIELGFERFCNHPVMPNSHAQFISSLNGELSWGKIYFRVGGRL